MEMYYAIQIIGYGAKQRYCIKDIWKDGDTTYLNPVLPGRVFRTEKAARKAADEKGLEIKIVGDFYHII